MTVHNTVSEIRQPCHTFPGILLKLRNPARQRDGGHYCAKTQHLQVTLPLPCAHFPLRDPGSRLWGSTVLPEPPRAGSCITSPGLTCGSSPRCVAQCLPRTAGQREQACGTHPGEWTRSLATDCLPLYCLFSLSPKKAYLSTLERKTNPISENTHRLQTWLPA